MTKVNFTPSPPTRVTSKVTLKTDNNLEQGHKLVVTDTCVSVGFTGSPFAEEIYMLIKVSLGQ